MEIARRHNIELKNLDYVQIHPTTLYSDNKEERSFLISESVRGEGDQAFIDKNMNRFVDELLPRDLHYTGNLQTDGERRHRFCVGRFKNHPA